MPRSYGLEKRTTSPFKKKFESANKKHGLSWKKQVVRESKLLRIILLAKLNGSQRWTGQ